MSTNVKIAAILAARPGKAGELEALLVGMAPACRAEPGNLRWNVWREMPHFKAYLARINDLAERAALVLDPAQLG